MSWDNYHNKIGLKQSEIACALSRFLKGKRDRALDLGAGHLRDSKYLIREGFFEVTAVDIHEPPKGLFEEGIVFAQSRIEEYIPEEELYDGCISTNSMYFMPKACTKHVFERVRAGLRQGGVFACNLLAQNDPWVKEQGAEKIAWVEKCDLKALHEGFRVILSENTFRRMEDFPNEKKDWHCHVFILEKL